MKVTPTPEPQTFTLTAGALKLSGVRQDGELGPVQRLVDAQKRTVFLWDMRSPFQKVFGPGLGFLIDKDVECLVMGGSAELISEITAAIAAAEAP